MTEQTRQQASPEAKANQSSATSAATQSTAPAQNGNGKRVERLPGSKLSMEPGSRLSLRLMCVDKRHEALLVGVRPYSYIVVELRLPQATLAALAENPHIIAQHTGAGAVQGFRTTVLSRLAKPAPILLLSYPETVERMALRSDERVQVSVPGLLHGRHGDHEIMLTDLTPSGCRVSAKVDLKSPLRDLELGERLILNCHLGPGQVFASPFVLRRIDEVRGLLYLGGQFVDMNAETADIVEGFVRKAMKFIR